MNAYEKYVRNLSGDDESYSSEYYDDPPSTLRNPFLSTDPDGNILRSTVMNNTGTDGFSYGASDEDSTDPDIAAHARGAHDLGLSRSHQAHPMHELQHIKETQDSNSQLLQVMDLIKRQNKERPVLQKVSPDVEAALKHRRQRGFYYDLYRISNASQLQDENEYNTSF